MKQAAILIVDDDTSVCVTVQRILEHEKYSVDVAHTQTEALIKTSGRAYDIVLIDMKLPASNGVKTFMAIKEIRSDAEGILITGHPGEMAHLIDSALESGLVSACFYKPLNVEELLMSIEQVWAAKNRLAAIEIAKTMFLSRALTWGLIFFALWTGLILGFPVFGSDLLYRVKQPVEIVVVSDDYVKLRFEQFAVTNLVVDTANQLHCDTVQMMPSLLNRSVAKGAQRSDDWVLLPNVAINGGLGDALCYYTGTVSYDAFGRFGPRVIYHWTSETFYVKRKEH